MRWPDRLFWIGLRAAWRDWKSALVVVRPAHGIGAASRGTGPAGRDRAAVARRPAPRSDGSSGRWRSRTLCLPTTPLLLQQLMLQPMMDPLLAIMSVLLSFLLTLRTWARSRAALQLEILALRHQLQVLQRTRPRRVRLAKTGPLALGPARALLHDRDHAFDSLGATAKAMRSDEVLSAPHVPWQRGDRSPRARAASRSAPLTNTEPPRRCRKVREWLQTLGRPARKSQTCAAPSRSIEDSGCSEAAWSRTDLGTSPRCALRVGRARQARRGRRPLGFGAGHGLRQARDQCVPSRDRGRVTPVPA